MSRSRRGLRPEQLTIEHYVLETEHIVGAVPAAACEAEAAKLEFYERFVAEVKQLRPLLCMPDYGVHIFHIGRQLCVCKDQKRSNDAVRAQIEELP